jgi:hypothetical protein
VRHNQPALQVIYRSPKGKMVDQESRPLESFFSELLKCNRQDSEGVTVIVDNHQSYCKLPQSSPPRPRELRKRRVHSYSSHSPDRWNVGFPNIHTRNGRNLAVLPAAPFERTCSRWSAQEDDKAKKCKEFVISQNLPPVQPIRDKEYVTLKSMQKIHHPQHRTPCRASSMDSVVLPKSLQILPYRIDDTSLVSFR